MILSPATRALIGQPPIQTLRRAFPTDRSEQPTQFIPQATTSYSLPEATVTGRSSRQLARTRWCGPPKKRTREEKTAKVVFVAPGVLPIVASAANWINEGFLTYSLQDSQETIMTKLLASIQSLYPDVRVSFPSANVKSKVHVHNFLHCHMPSLTCTGITSLCINVNVNIHISVSIVMMSVVIVCFTLKFYTTQMYYWLMCNKDIKYIYIY